MVCRGPLTNSHASGAQATAAPATKAASLATRFPWRLHTTTQISSTGATGAVSNDELTAALASRPAAAAKPAPPRRSGDAPVSVAADAAPAKPSREADR